MICGCGDSRLNAWISLRLFTYTNMISCCEWLVAYLLDRVEVVLHALDRHVLARLDALRLQNLRERALALLAYQSVL